MTYQPDDKGFYGEFGTETFKEEFDALLKDYVGRPTPLYFARVLR